MLSSYAILRAQKEQLKIEAQGNEAQRLEDKEKESSKLKKAQTTLDKFTSNGKILGPDWKVIIAYNLPRYKLAEKLVAYQTNPKIQAKLEELEKEMVELDLEEDSDESLSMAAQAAGGPAGAIASWLFGEEALNEAVGTLDGMLGEDAAAKAAGARCGPGTRWDAESELCVLE